MMLVYSDTGDMHNKQASEFAKKLSEQVDDFLQDLFDQGMTVLECRALLGYIKCGLDFTACLKMLRAKADKKESEKDDCSGPNHGASAARDD